MANFDLTPKERYEAFQTAYEALEEVYAHPDMMSVAPILNVEEVKAYVKNIPFDPTNDFREPILKVIEGLKKYAVHTQHPRYFGLFNPRVNAISIIADYITAVMNPQMAAWSHAPFANEAERSVIHQFGKRFGYSSKSIDGTMCGGGAESNLTAVQCALNFHFDQVTFEGVMSIAQRPIIYCSTESHHSIVKAARTIGIGSDSVVTIPVNTDLTMDINYLKKQIKKDINKGHKPFMIVATAGTTGSGAIDDLSSIAKISKKRNLWMHVDGAYGAALVASETYKSLLKGIKKSDSITIDFHKWFSVPMGASAFITSNPEILFKTFNIKTDYMPPDGDQKECVDPYLHSLQWSRRFIGLKIFLALSVFGWDGYQKMIDKDIEMGNKLRKKLQENNWKMVNRAKIPVLCFTHPDIENDNNAVRVIADSVVKTGQAWVSIYPIKGKSTIRACVSNYSTSEEDLDILVDALNKELADLSTAI